ncbi:helicase SRCAP-like, partial [Apteryx rowi]|uniref:helicase SRCAP-like n=1 Tax=Apteryx rowi TaxID=308060 RepID=UPI000E1D2BC2
MVGSWSHQGVLKPPKGAGTTRDSPVAESEEEEDDEDEDEEEDEEEEDEDEEDDDEEEEDEEEDDEEDEESEAAAPGAEEDRGEDCGVAYLLQGDEERGWTKPNAFHVCITSYKLVLQDHQAFRRKNWKYLILDEAQNIKNFKSQRWQSLLNFNSQRRLLLTGTPLQNSLMELWSLMHFLMPHVFQSHREFKEWFSNPLTGMIEGSQEYNESLVKRLHKVLRPFLLRRVKVDVEKQMPKKYEHVIKCRLSKRQRYLYDDFMGQASTKATLATGHFMSVINVLMQLRKVCNHPNLFDPRPIHSPFITEGICFVTASLVLRALDPDPFKQVDMGLFDLVGLEGRASRYAADTFLPRWRVTRRLLEDVAAAPDPPPRPKPVKMKVNR